MRRSETFDSPDKLSLAKNHAYVQKLSVLQPHLKNPPHHFTGRNRPAWPPISREVSGPAS